MQWYVFLGDMYQYESPAFAPKKHEKKKTEGIGAVACGKVVIRLFVYFF
jgi:hypothetical protein